MENLALRVEHLQLSGSDTLLGLHDNHAEPGNIAEETVGILGADAKHVLRQLLGNGGGATRATHEDILYGSDNTLEVNSVVLVETLVLRINKRLVEHGRDILVAHGGAVLAEKLAYFNTIGGINDGGLACLGVHDAVNRRHLAKEPEQIDEDSEDIEEEEKEKGHESCEQLLIPRLAAIETTVPAPHRHRQHTQTLYNILQPVGCALKEIHISAKLPFLLRIPRFYHGKYNFASFFFVTSRRNKD